MTSDSLSGERLYDDVITYARMGEHRTGSPADLTASEWIEARLREAGCKTGFMDWQFRQFFVEGCNLRVYGREIDCFPLWFPVVTGPEPVKASLVMIPEEQDHNSASGKLALVAFDQIDITTQSNHIKIIKSLADAGALGVIGINGIQTPEICGNNPFPPFNQAPLPIPAVLVGIKDWHVLENAVRTGEEVSLLIEGRDEPEAQARNVIGRLERGKDWIVVSTPQSGWFRCASERGAGVAIFLALASWAGKESGGPNYLFLSNPGHEIGHMGMHHCFDHGDVPGPGKVLCWLHLGATIAAWKWRKEGPYLRRDGVSDMIRLGCSPELQPLLTDTFAGVPHLSPAAGDAAGGELVWVIEKGYRGFGIFGSQDFFRTPGDGPENTAPELLEPVGRALVDSFRAIIRDFHE